MLRHEVLHTDTWSECTTDAEIQISLLLPASSAQQAFQDKLSSTGDGVLSYARVYMKPLDLISGDFFNSYIKSGNVLILSEGRSGTDNVLSLSDGVLRIEVDKPTYEKMGLEGKSVGGEGRKHVKARFGGLYLLPIFVFNRGRSEKKQVADIIYAQ